MKCRFFTRLWYIKKKKMLYLNDKFTTHNDPDQNIKEFHGCKSGNSFIVWNFSQESMQIPTFFENEYIPMQCTGLRDKTYRLIYEGDIVKDGFNNIYKVYYDDEGCSFFADRLGESKGNFVAISLNGINRIEIIGNIHKHPHLLEENKDDA